MTEPNAFAPVRVWVTRPEAQAQATAQLLEQLGCQYWLQPVMSIKPIEPGPAERSQVLALDNYHAAIFISQNAVQYGLALIDQLWPQLPVGLHLMAIGKATAKALQNHGLVVQSATGAMDSEALLALPELQQLSDQKVLIFKGVGGRGYLSDTLATRGAQVDECALYQRCREVRAVANLQACDFGALATDTLLAYSGESVQYLTQTLAGAGRLELLGQPLVVPGERVADIARQLGYQQVRVAENASDSAMLAQLGLNQYRQAQ